MEQVDLVATARTLSADMFAPNAPGIDQSEEYPWAHVDAMADSGLCGMTIPVAWGGRGIDWLTTVKAIEEVAKGCTVTARILVECNLGAIAAIMKYGSDEQKRVAAALVLAGDKPAICITEPEAGSAATSMTTTAHETADGYVINGAKHWITGGGISKLYLIFARVIDRLGKDCGIAGFMTVADEVDGLHVVNREPTMGIRGMPEARVEFHDLRLPKSAMLRNEEGKPYGFKALMSAYNSQRVGAAAVALGLAQAAFELAVDFCKQREQFGRPIAEFQGLQWTLADMSVQIAASRAMIHQAAASDVEGFPDPHLAAQAKIFASETAVKVTNDALQLHGARGYSRNCQAERFVRDARMFTIGGGTAQVLRNLVASNILDTKLPQTRRGYWDMAETQMAEAKQSEALQGETGQPEARQIEDQQALAVAAE